jgi:hypothetical protein
MKSAVRHLFLLSSIAVLQTSCSLPPAQAWKIVNSQGLIPYIAMETGRRPFPPGVTPIRRQPTSTVRPMGLATQPAPVDQNRYIAAPGSGVSTAGVPRALPASSAAVPNPAPTPRLTTTPPKPRLSAAPKPPVKKAVEAPPPKPAVKPPVKPAAPKAAASPAPKPTVSPAPKPKVNSAPTPAPKPATTPKPSTPAPAAAPKSDAPKPAAAPAPAPAPAAAPQASGIPFGSPIPGRPGLVNSPYAGKHQIVDVSGLQAGQEIKCPYSGRLFLVPPGQVSANKATAPGAPKP